MEISGSAVCAGFALFGAGLLAGGVCLAVHALHIPVSQAAAGMFAFGMPMAITGGVTFVCTCVGAVSLKIKEKEESDKKKETTIENEDLSSSKERVFNSIKV